MGKIAFIYPGQGAQKPGMGQDFYEKSILAREFFEEAEKVLDFPLMKICFAEEGSQEAAMLNDTAYTQPAMVASCLAMTQELTSRGVKPDVTAGLSLGEYAAIATAGGMNSLDAVRLVRDRGVFMSEAVPQGEGTMAAVLGLTGQQVEELVAPLADVYVANYNCPGQVVITGKTEAVRQAGELIKEHGAKRVVELVVSGPFHSPLLEGAGCRLKEKLQQVQFQPLSIPYVTNVTAEYVTDVSETAELLERQVSSSVRWEQSILAMRENGVDKFVEIGPGKTLCGFLRKICPEAEAYHVETYEDVDKLVASLTEGR